MKYILSLGSNLNDRIANIRRAMAGLESFSRINAVSDLYESAPFGGVEQPDFVNIVAEVETSLRPFRLLRKIKALEMQVGRTKSVRWGPRVIDIDIVEWEGETISGPVLSIPHPGLEKRKFVLQPLAQIQPDFRNRAGADIRQLLSECRDRSPVTRIGPF